ncbi:unnamed protein product [Pylaiella littoralis]
MVHMHRYLALASCSICIASAFVGNPSARVTDGRIKLGSSGDSLSRVSTSTVGARAAPVPPQQPQRRRRRQPAIVPLKMSSRTMDVEVIDVTDVTDEEARREEEQRKQNDRIGRLYKGRPTAEVAKDVRELLDEALKIFRDAGPQVVGARGIRASRAVLLTLSDVVRDWREGKLLRPKSDRAADPAPAAPAPASGAGAGVAAAAAAALSGQELDPAGAARALRLLFERLGATYIKLGQFIASSPTLFPPEYVLEFQKCLDATDPVPYSKILAIVKEELGGGARVSEEFAYIDPKPLASASVAQVHRAKLRTGEKVVLKVRKPGVEGTLQADLGFLYIASRLLEILQPELGRTSFAAIASDIRTAMLDELDFRKEAKNIEDFTEFLGKAGITDAVAPKVYESLSSRRVLVMERLKGVALTDLDGIKDYSSNPEATLITALNTWSMSVMMAESFHADGRVGFIDFGIVGRIPETVWSSLRDLRQEKTATAVPPGIILRTNGFITNNYRLMASSLVKMGAADGEVDVNAFAFDIEKVMDSLGSVEARLDTSAVIEEDTGRVSYGTSVNVDQESITKLLLDIIGVAENNGLKLPREFGMLIKQALYFDRYTRLLAPDLDPLRDDRVTLPNGEGRDDARLPR